MVSKYPVLEIFDSFQGEGGYQGVFATFVRFAGCNLACPWCDTKDTMEQRPEMLTAEEIAERCKQRVVVLTGGEPTLYDLASIASTTPDTRFILETNGTREVKETWMFSGISCSPKPQSNYYIHPSIRKIDFLGDVCYKYVVDERLSEDVIREHKNKSYLVYLQPEASNYKKSLEKAKRMLAENDFGYNVRLGIQAHKFWGVR